MTQLFPKRLSNRLKSYSKETEGSVSVEFAFYLPFLLMIFASIYTYFDAFRQDSANLKAAYTISDLISRETNILNEDYIDSMHNMASLLVRSDSSLGLRISVVRWDQDAARYYVDWSKVRGGILTTWSDTTIINVADDLPTMPDQERVILVETVNEVEAAFKIGLPDMEIRNFVFSRPRFAPQVLFEGILPGGSENPDDPGTID